MYKLSFKDFNILILILILILVMYVNHLPNSWQISNRHQTTDTLTEDGQELRPKHVQQKLINTLSNKLVLNIIHVIE